MILHIAYTGKELLRKKVLLFTLILTVGFFAFYFYGLSQIAKDLNNVDLIQNYMSNVLIITLGLFFAQMISAFFVIFSSMGAISGEQENGLLFAVLSRPVPRWKIFLGKWVGFSVWNALYSAILFLCIILPVHWILGHPLLYANLIRAFLLFEWIPILLSALVLLGSSYLPTLGNGIACALLFGMGMFSGLLENVFNTNLAHPGISNFSLFASLLIPTDAVFRRMTYELLGAANLLLGQNSLSMGPFLNSQIPSNAFLIYTGAYLVLVLAGGIIHFRKKDIA